jgi:hypothetical protein
VFEIRPSGTTRSVGAIVSIWELSPWGWEYTGLKTYTNSYGQYYFPHVPTEKLYAVFAEKTYGSCPKLFRFWGRSTTF